MKENLTQILMNEAIREGWREWMAKVRTVLPQTDAERPVTWIAAERLARDHGRMVRLVELAQGTPPRPFLPCAGRSRIADTGRLPPARQLGGLPAGYGGGVFPGEGLRRIPVPLPDAGKHQRLRRIPAPERALQPSGGTAVPLPP